MTYSFNSFTLFLSYADSLGSWWKRRVIIAILAQKLKELLWVLSNQLCQLWIASADLL
jgi:hypothetical protein